MLKPGIYPEQHIRVNMTIQTSLGYNEGSCKSDLIDSGLTKVLHFGARIWETLSDSNLGITF